MFWTNRLVTFHDSGTPLDFILLANPEQENRCRDHYNDESCYQAVKEVR